MFMHRMMSLLLGIVLLAAFLCPFSEAASSSDRWFYLADPDNAFVTDIETAKQAMSAGSDGNEKWKAFPFPRIPNSSIDNKPVWITETVNGNKDAQQENVLLFETDQASLSLFADDRLLYRYGDVLSKEPESGSRWHIVPLPPEDDGYSLTFEIRSSPNSIFPAFQYFSTGSALDQTERVFLYDLPIVIAAPLSFLLILVLSLYCYSQAGWKRLYRSVIFFLLTFVCWMFCGSVLRQIYIYDNIFLQYLRYILMYLLVIDGNIIAHEVIEKRYKKAITACSVLLSTVLIGTVFTEASLHIGIEIGTIAFFILLFVNDGLLIFLLYHSSQQGNAYSHALLITISSFWILTVIDGINAYTHYIASYLCITPISIFFSLPFVLQMLHGQIRREQNLEFRAGRLKKQAEIAAKRSETDALTQCWNRAKFDAVLKQMIEEADDKKQVLAFIMFDIDHFKSFNDTFGHKMGDQVLNKFAGTIKKNLPPDKWFFRWGGEEFVILLFCHDSLRAAELGDRMRRAVEKAQLCEYRTVTVSVGVSFWHGEGDSIQSLFERADGALYRAKADGRNCLRFETERRDA